MRSVDDFISDFLAHRIADPETPAERRERYLRERELKGRKTGSSTPAPVARRPSAPVTKGVPKPAPKKPSVDPAKKRAETEARIEAMQQRLDTLRELLRQPVLIIVVVVNILLSTDAIHSGDGLVAVRVVEVNAALAVFLFLKQPQTVPDEACFTQWITTTVMFGFCRPTTQWVIGHSDDRILGAAAVMHLDQTVFGIVDKALYPMAAAAFFDHPAKGVVTITLVLVGQ